MKIFYTIDESMRVFPIADWSENIEPEEGWRVGEIEGAAYEAHGVPLWKDEGEGISARTAAEIKTDVDEIPIQEPTESDQLRADVDFLTMENEYLEGESEQARADIDYLLMLTEEE